MIVIQLLMQHEANSYADLFDTEVVVKIAKIKHDCLTRFTLMYLLCIEPYAQIRACSMMHRFELLYSHIGVFVSRILVQPRIG